MQFMITKLSSVCKCVASVPNSMKIDCNKITQVSQWCTLRSNTLNSDYIGFYPHFTWSSKVAALQQKFRFLNRIQAHFRPLVPIIPMQPDTFVMGEIKGRGTIFSFSKFTSTPLSVSIKTRWQNVKLTRSTSPCGRHVHLWRLRLHAG